MKHSMTRRLCSLAVAGSILLGLGACEIIGWDQPELTDVDPPQATTSNTKAPPSDPPKELAVDRDLVVLLQRQLRIVGHDPGSIDGLFGPNTRRAVKAFQQAKGRSADGRITDQLMADLAHDAANISPDDGRGARAEPQYVIAVDQAPRYLAGSRYVYSNGEVLGVVAVEGVELRWQSNRGTAFTAHRNFMVPPLSWSDSDETGTRVFNIAVDQLWRQAMQSGAAFSATATTRHGERPDSLTEDKENWRCRRDGSETLTVAAGRFATEKLVCERHAADNAVDLVRAWYYAPSLRHFVRRVERKASGPNDPPLDLVAIQPDVSGWPPAARAGLDWATQHALETLPDGAEQPWRSPAVEPQVMITPESDVALAGYNTCRRYRQVWTIDQKDWIFPLVACRDASGAWVFPAAPGPDRVAHAEGTGSPVAPTASAGRP